MYLGVIFVVILIIGFCMESKTGKILLSTGLIALGCLLLDMITGFDLFITLAKLCAIIIVVVIIGVIVMSIFVDKK